MCILSLLCYYIGQPGESGPPGEEGRQGRQGEMNDYFILLVPVVDSSVAIATCTHASRAHISCVVLYLETLITVSGFENFVCSYSLLPEKCTKWDICMGMYLTQC